AAAASIASSVVPAPSPEPEPDPEALPAPVAEEPVAPAPAPAPVPAHAPPVAAPAVKTKSRTRPEAPETVQWRAGGAGPESQNGPNGTQTNGTANGVHEPAGVAAGALEDAVAPPKKRKWRLFRRAG